MAPRLGGSAGASGGVAGQPARPTPAATRGGDAMSIPDPLPGRYQHYKGGFYEVLGVARHSETDEELVVYRPLYGDRGLWVRPKAMFCDSVTVEGRAVPR